MHTELKKIKDVLRLFPTHTQLSISIIREGVPAYYGLFKNDNDVSAINNKDFAFEIGSITKVFTANLLAMMVERGEVSLEETIETFLPFRLHGTPVITLKQLVSHTSGMPRLPADFSSYPQYLHTNPYLNYNEEKLAAYLSQSMQLERHPGTKFIYSNLGYGVLSYILETMKNEAFHELIKKYILSSVGMENSGFDRRKIKVTMVKGRDQHGVETSYWGSGIMSGCIGMISTAADLSRFALQMLKPEKNINKLQLQPLADIRPGVQMCMGWAKSSAWNEPEVFWHGGGTAGFGSVLTLVANYRLLQLSFLTLLRISLKNILNHVHGNC